jgi:hypothetical protein
MIRVQKIEQFIKLFYILFFIFLLFGFFKNVSAAELFCETERESYFLGDVLIIEAKINTEDEYINTVQTTLTWPKDILEIVDFNLGNSILTIQPDKPSINKEQGSVFFVGGIPGGFWGTKGLIAKLVFRAIKEGEGKIKFSNDSVVLLNDGLGTKTKVKTKDLNIKVLSGETGIARDLWQEEKDADTIMPESFKPIISQDPNIFEGKYFLVFSTVDKQTGIDYYQVKEGEGEWVNAESPYLLKNQDQSSVIQVKAVDKAGNERIETISFIPTKKKVSEEEKVETTEEQEKVEEKEKKVEKINKLFLITLIFKYKIIIAVVISIIILIVVISSFRKKKRQSLKG